MAVSEDETGTAASSRLLSCGKRFPYPVGPLFPYCDSRRKDESGSVETSHELDTKSCFSGAGGGDYMDFFIAAVFIKTVQNALLVGTPGAMKMKKFLKHRVSSLS